MRFLSLYGLFCILSAFLLNAQVGGEHAYQLLNLPNSARNAALGGLNISMSGDLSQTYYNPALLRKDMNRQVSINYANYLADINFGYLAYADSNRFGTIAYGLHYINYGKFLQTDEYGIVHGTFSANDMVFTLSYAYALDSSFYAGINLKPVFSFLETYYSLALASDLGLNYQSPDKLLSASFVVRNLGFPIVNYTPGNYEPLPFELMLGVTKKLKHAPFRFTLLARHLERYNLRYESNSSEVSWAEDTELNFFQKAGDEFLRHLVMGIELLPSKNLFLAFGYNHQRRKELALSTNMSVVGFSFGFGFNVSKFSFAYGLAKYHLAGSSHQISIRTNLTSF